MTEIKDPNSNPVATDTSQAVPAPAESVLEVEESVPLTVRPDAVESVRQGLIQKNALDVVEAAEGFPAAPADGFKSIGEFSAFVEQMNWNAVRDFADFKAHPEKYRPRDLENPGKYISEILCECADGRNSITLFLPQDKLNQRFNTDWLPAAGTIVFPDVPTGRSADEIRNNLETAKVLREAAFDRLDLLYGPKVKEFLDENAKGLSSKMQIEFQSHYDSEHYPKKGCGAWKSNFSDAQKETVKNCVITEEWLKDRYPDQYEKGSFRVIRTAHDTMTKKIRPEGVSGHEIEENGSVYSGGFLDDILTTSEKAGYERLFTDAARYEPIVFENAGKKITREFKGNPLSIETGEHNEQAIRVSNLHLAHTLVGQSVMEICWTDNPETLFGHIKILLGIISTHFGGKNPDKPAIIHFDLVKGDRKIGDVYRKLQQLMAKDTEVRSALKSGKLQVLVTDTSREDMKSEPYLKPGEEFKLE